jgi:F-type H+/Na+-transporting ATPase subunit alpha
MTITRIINEIENKIQNTDLSVNVEERGVVVAFQDGVARVSGLRKVQSMELVRIQKNNSNSNASLGEAGQRPEGAVLGFVLNLEEDVAGIVLLGSGVQVAEGDEVFRTKELLSLPVGEEFLGRVINPVGEIIDDNPNKKTPKQKRNIEFLAPGVMEREPVNQPLQTGIKAIDGMIPIGKGQRELIIGDRQTGKTTVALDTIINQKGKNVVCVYVAIGQKESKIAQVVESLKAKGAMDYTIVVLAGISQGPAFTYLAPYAGVAVAEYFMDKGQDVLIVYDDLSKQAVAYRELSLILKRSPGREAYPGDVFYIHSRLLERACRRNTAAGGGSITALPIIETQAGDVSAYIPTNVISITDGQIFLDSNLFNKGIRPAIDVGLSVSRVGGSAQTSAIKKNAGKVKLSLAQYRELEAFSQFDGDLDADTKAIINHGKKSVELLKQRNGETLSVGEQTISYFALNEKFFNDVDIKNVQTTEKELHQYVKTNSEETFTQINNGKWSDDLANSLKETIKAFAQMKGVEFKTK